MKQLFQNTLFSSADTFILIALSLVGTRILVDGLGPSGYGAYVFLSIFSIYGALSFFDFGMEGALMTHVARFEADGQHEKVRAALGVCIVYYGVIGAALGLALWGGGSWLTTHFIVHGQGDAGAQAQVLTAFSLVGLNVFLQFLTSPFIAVLQGLRRFVLTKSINSAVNITQYLVMFGVVLSTQRLDHVFWVITAGTVLRLVAYCVGFVRVAPGALRPVGRADLDLLKPLLSSSSMLFFNRLIGLVYNQVGKFLIGWRLPITQMGVYDIASRPASLIRVINGMMYSAVIPEVSRLQHLGDTLQIKDLYIRIARYSYLAILPLVVAIALHASTLLSLWVGPAFAAYGPLVALLMLASAISPLASLASTLVVGLDAVRQTVWISVAGTVVNVVVSAALVGPWGVFGVLSGVVMAELTMAVPYFLVTNRLLGARALEVLGPLLAIAALASAFGGVHAVLGLGAGPPSLHWAGVVALLLMLHYVVQYFVLLSLAERRFLARKLGFAGPDSPPECLP